MWDYSCFNIRLIMTSFKSPPIATAQYTAHPTFVAPQLTFQGMEWQQQPQHSVPSTNPKSNPFLSVSSGPSNAAHHLGGTLSSSNHATRHTLPAQPQAIPLCMTRVSRTDSPVSQHLTSQQCPKLNYHLQKSQLSGTLESCNDFNQTQSTSQVTSTSVQHVGHWSVVSNHQHTCNEGENISSRCQLQTSKRLWKRQRRHYFKTSPSNASKVLPIQSGPCNGPLLFHSTSPSKLAGPKPNVFAGSETATELTSPNMEDRASLSPHSSSLNNDSFSTSFLDFPNEMDSNHQCYSMWDTAVLGMHTVGLSAKKKGE